MPARQGFSGRSAGRVTRHERPPRIRDDRGRPGQDPRCLQAGVSAASSGFEKNVSTLSGFGFVTYPERGYVQVADIMFVER